MMQDDATLNKDRPAAVFDLDGTLVDSSLEIYAAVSQTMKQWKSPPIDRNLIFSLIGRPPEQFFRGHIRDEDIPLAVLTFRSHLEVIAGTMSKVFDGTLDALEACSERGMMLAVASNKSTHLARIVVERLALSPYFSAVLGTDGLRSKPSPDVVIEALNCLGATGGVMVGDTKMDIDAGHGAGLFTIGLTHGPTGGVGIEGADLVLEGMSPLAELMRQGRIP